MTSPINHQMERSDAATGAISLVAIESINKTSHTMVQRSFIVLALCLISNALLSTAFVPVTGVVKRTAISDTTIFSSEEGGEYVPEEQVPVPQQIPQQPPVPRQKRLDPLLAS